MNKHAVYASIALLVAGGANAQYREDQSHVVALTPRPLAAPPVDYSQPFNNAYTRAGNPRVVLMWNREFNDVSQTTYLDRKVTRETGQSSGNSLDKTTQGPSDSATLNEFSKSNDSTRVVTAGKVAAGEPTRTVKLEARAEAMIEKAFAHTMSNAGMIFVDRALVMRTTAAMHHRGGGDQRLIETDALLKHGDLLLEVLLIEDKDAPAGYAFDVKAKSMKSGVVIASMYTQGIPIQDPQREGRFVASDGGYDFKRPAGPPPPTPPQIGEALARDVMASLASSLPKR
jgi:hypothetical protein